MSVRLSTIGAIILARQEDIRRALSTAIAQGGREVVARLDDDEKLGGS